MSTSKRARPTDAQPQQSQLDTLDQLEQRAKERLASDGRAPLTGSLNLSWSDKHPDYHYYWHSDSDNIKLTFDDLLNNGYEFVRHGFGAQIGQKVVKKRGATTNYLMRIPNKLHDEHQAAMRAEIARKEIDLNQVGSREYGGDSKELGKGTAVKAGYTESPLMQGEQEQ